LETSKLETGSWKLETDHMPKLKTHRGAAKRFKKTASGKFMRSKAFKRHILTSKTTKSKRQMRGTREVSEADAPKLARMLPYK
jgi:large subunit ribosomal protein L35